jgi:hypothetical protein
MAVDVFSVAGGAADGLLAGAALHPANRRTASAGAASTKAARVM